MTSRRVARKTCARRGSRPAQFGFLRISEPTDPFVLTGNMVLLAMYRCGSNSAEYALSRSLEKLGPGPADTLEWDCTAFDFPVMTGSVRRPKPHGFSLVYVHPAYRKRKQKRERTRGGVSNLDAARFPQSSVCHLLEAAAGAGKPPAFGHHAVTTSRFTEGTAMRPLPHWRFFPPNHRWADYHPWLLTDFARPASIDLTDWPAPYVGPVSQRRMRMAQVNPFAYDSLVLHRDGSVTVIECKHRNTDAGTRPEGES